MRHRSDYPLIEDSVRRHEEAWMDHQVVDIFGDRGYAATICSCGMRWTVEKREDEP